MDNFAHRYTIVPAALVMALVFHSYAEGHQLFELVWSFSIWLESVAAVPQLYMIYKIKQVSAPCALSRWEPCMLSWAG